MSDRPRFVRLTNPAGFVHYINVDSIDAIVEPSAVTGGTTGLSISGQPWPCLESVDDILLAIGAETVGISQSA